MKTISIKEIEKNHNLVLSIVEDDGTIVNSCGYMNSCITLREGTVYSDKELYRILKYMDLRANPQRYDKKINQWTV